LIDEPELPFKLVAVDRIEAAGHLQPGDLDGLNTASSSLESEELDDADALTVAVNVGFIFMYVHGLSFSNL